MNTRALVLIVALGDAGCEPPLDRGACLRSHVVAYHRDEQFVCLPTIGVDGTMSLACDTEPARDWTETICDEWEFPNGKAEKGP